MIQTIIPKIAVKLAPKTVLFSQLPLKRITKPKTKAKLKLAKGPAKATFAGPYFLSRNRRKSTGTGLAQPKTIPGPEKMLNNKRKPGIKIEPIGSKCFKGFRLSLPLSFAVESPKW